jgi:hypothetical protein
VSLNPRLLADRYCVAYTDKITAEICGYLLTWLLTDRYCVAYTDKIEDESGNLWLLADVATC